MTHWVERHKPAATATTHLVLAWMMWLTVGSAMALFGAIWLWQAIPVQAPLVAVAAVALGVVKSRFVLDGAANRVIKRIEARGDGRCLGGFLSLRTWGLVVLMMAGGRILRGNVARGIVGPLYLAVGVALCLSSRLSWKAWRAAVRNG